MAPGLSHIDESALRFVDFPGNPSSLRSSLLSPCFLCFLLFFCFLHFFLEVLASESDAELLDEDESSLLDCRFFLLLLCFCSSSSLDAEFSSELSFLDFLGILNFWLVVELIFKLVIFYLKDLNTMN